MSEYLAAAAAAVGGPEDLVAKSASARAAAQGVSADDILKAWAGGEAVAAAPAPAQPAPAVTDAGSTEAPASAAAPTEQSSAEPSPTATAAPASAPPIQDEPAVAIGTAGVMVEEEEAVPVEPASLRDRIVFPGKLGAVVGAMFGMLAAVGVSPFFIDRATLAGTDDAIRSVLDVNPLRFLIGAVVLSAVFGGVVGRLSGIVPAWFDAGLAVRTSARTNTIIGAALGVALGVVGAGALLSAGTPVEQLSDDAEAITQLSVLSTMVAVLIGGAILGAITAVATQVLALPAGLTEEEQDESEVIKHRLATSFLMPGLVIAGIAALVLPFAYLLVSFHSVAPLLAIVAAGGILGFAGLSASRPGMKITAGEFFVAAAGIGALLLIIALVANATGGEVHEESLRLVLGG